VNVSQMLISALKGGSGMIPYLEELTSWTNFSSPLPLAAPVPVTGTGTASCGPSTRMSSSRARASAHSCPGPLRGLKMLALNLQSSIAVLKGNQEHVQVAGQSLRMRAIWLKMGTKIGMKLQHPVKSDWRELNLHQF